MNDISLNESEGQQNNVKSKKNSLEKEKYFEVLKYMQKKYPKSFTKTPTLLAIGIHHEIRKNESQNMSNNLINRFLFIYTRSKKYKSTIIVGANRVDLA